MTVKLWPHQERAIAMSREEFRKGNRWVCIVMPTGAGKTVTVTEIASQALARKPDLKILALVHREELVGQMFDTMEVAGLSCGVIQATPCRVVNPYRPIQIASIQTIVARKMTVDDVGLVICDECHHFPSNEWMAVPLEYKRKGAFGIGLTATPVRADGLPLGDIFDAIVEPTSIRELIDAGHLVPFELHQPRRVLGKGQIAQCPVEAYLQHARGRKAIVFARVVKDGRAFVDKFRAAGITCDIVHGKQDAVTRRQVLGDYKRGAIQVLVNVAVLTEGFDHRPTDCIIIARSVGSLSLLLQICGRGLRAAPEVGKRDCVIIDLFGSTRNEALGPPDKDQQWSLEGEGKRKGTLEQPTERFCQVCGCLLEDSNVLICPDCGLELGGKPLEIVNVPLVKYARKRAENDDRRASTLHRWIKEAKDAGHKVGRAYWKYMAVYGERPTKEVLAKLKTIQQTYASVSVDNR